MAIFVKHIGCSRCGSSDANAVYSDGSEHCFSCGWNSSSDRPGWKAEKEDDEQVVHIPDDATTHFPQVVVDWIKPTTITIEELIRERYFFQQSASRLGRALFSDCDRELSRRSQLDPICAIDYRNFGEHRSRPKSRFLGSKEEARAQAGGHLLQRSGRVILVEDSLSSLRVARYFCSEPLFGSTVSNNKLSRMTEGAAEVVVWLDSDKYRSAVDIASRCQSLGKRARAVVTELDPKYIENIPEVLQ